MSLLMIYYYSAISILANKASITHIHSFYTNTCHIRVLVRPSIILNSRILMHGVYIEIGLFVKDISTFKTASSLILSFDYLGQAPNVMKNCEPFVPGPLFAIDKMPIVIPQHPEIQMLKNLNPPAEVLNMCYKQDLASLGYWWPCKWYWHVFFYALSHSFHAKFPPRASCRLTNFSSGKCDP